MGTLTYPFCWKYIMSLMKNLKKVNENLKTLYDDKINHTYYTSNYLENGSMSINFNSLKQFIIQWLPPQDQYCMIFTLYSDTELILNTWDMSPSTSTWNDDFIIEFNIERSYFDCLSTVYQMPRNFKFEHLKILKEISVKYLNIKTEIK